MTDMPQSAIPQSATHPSRRGFLGRAALVAAAPAAAAILGPALIPASAAHADAAPAGDLPSFAPVPPSAFGPALNADGYFVGPIKDNLYWVTDGFYQSMFLATTHGVVVVDAPPTIGHNLLRAIKQVTTETGTPSTVTHVVYSHFTPTTSGPPRFSATTCSASDMSKTDGCCSRPTTRTVRPRR